MSYILYSPCYIMHFSQEILCKFSLFLDWFVNYLGLRTVLQFEPDQILVQSYVN